MGMLTLEPDVPGNQIEKPMPRAMIGELISYIFNPLFLKGILIQSDGEALENPTFRSNLSFI